MYSWRLSYNLFVSLPIIVYPLEILLGFYIQFKSFSINWNGCWLWTWDIPNYFIKWKDKIIKNCEILESANFIIAQTALSAPLLRDIFLTCNKILIKNSIKLKKKKHFQFAKVLVQDKLPCHFCLIQTNHHNQT